MSLDNKLVITNLCADANEAEKCETPTVQQPIKEMAAMMAFVL